MGSPVARGDGIDTVLSDTGSGVGCPDPLTTETDECSEDVKVNGTGVVRKDDNVALHNKTLCVTESPALSTYSATVKANGKNIGRSGDDYNGDGANVITSGSGNVNAG